MAEKGLNRGGTKGQQGELGNEQSNLNRPGWQQEQGDVQRKGNPDQSKRKPPAQPGGISREPDLTGREEETGHQVD